MLTACHANMPKERFNALPSSTNAVESHNRLSKKQHPEILKVAMLTTYKVDMASTLEHIARLEGVSSSYGITQGSKRKRKENFDEDDGPPDKRRHFSTGMYYLLSCNPYCTGHVEWQLNTLPVCFFFYRFPESNIQDQEARSAETRHVSHSQVNARLKEVKRPRHHHTQGKVHSQEEKPRSL